MSGTNLPNLGLTSEQSDGFDGWGVAYRRNHRIMDAVIQAGAEYESNTPPAGTPTNGSLYICGSAPTGVWAGQPRALALYAANEWIFLTPKEGWTVFNKNLNRHLVFSDAGRWVPHSELNAGGVVLDARTFGVVGDGVTDNTPAFNAIRAACVAAGGATVRFQTGNFASTGVKLAPRSVYEGQGTGTIFSLLPGVKGHVVSSDDYDTLSQMRLRTAITLPASGTVVVELTTVATLAVNQRIAFVSRDGLYRWRGTITNISAPNVTLSWGAGAAYAAQIGDMVYNLDNAGPGECGVRNIYIQGNRNTTAGLDNVCLPQTRGSAGALVMNGDRCVIWPDGEMRSDFQTNTRLRFESTGDNSARTITITNARVLQKDGSITTEATMTLTGPGAGPANAVYTPLPLCGCSGISIDGAVTGNIWCGIPSGPTAGHGLALFGPRQIVENVVSQFLRGWGTMCDWGLYAEGWTDSIATQRGVVRNIQVFMGDGGGIFLNGPLDCDASELCVNQTYHRLIEIGRRALNMRVSMGHVSAAYENSARFIRPFEGVHIEADSATVIGVAAEGASNANYNVLANNVTLLEAQPFDPNNSPFASVERAVGVAIGDTRTGWAPQNLRATVRGFNLSGGMFDFRFDGGDNRCEGSGYDVAASISANTTNTVTIGGLVANFAVGEPAFIRNGAGATQQFTVSAINTGTGVVTLNTTITIAIAPGALLCRGNLISGTPHPTTVVDVSAINTATQRLYRRPGGMALNRPDSLAAELFLGWPQGGTEAFILNRAAGALRIGTNNVEALTLGARGGSADVYLPTAGAYATHAAAAAAGLPEGALFYDSVSGNVKRRNAGGTATGDAGLLSTVSGGLDSTLRNVRDGKGDTAPIRASTIEIAIDATRATGGTTLRSLGDHLRDDGVNVLDFGAQGNGVFNNTTAFAGAYSTAANGGVALVPPGAYAGTMPVETGGKRLLWLANGATDASGTVPLDVPGFYEGIFGGRRLFRHSQTSATDVVSWDYQRVVSNTAGTPGNTNNAIRVTTYVNSNTQAFEWAGLFVLDSQASNAAEHAALYAQGIKRNAGGVLISAVSELKCLTADPTRSSVAHEFNIFGVGADTNNARIAIDVLCDRDSGGALAEIYAGIRVAPRTPAVVTYKNYILTQGASAAGVGWRNEASGVTLLRDAGTWHVGVDLLNGTYSHAAIRVPSNALITLDNSAANALRFNSAANFVEFALAGTAYFQANGNGVVNVAGPTAQYQVSGQTVVVSRRAGWANATGALTRTTFDTGTVTLPQLAERVAALINDLHVSTGHGLIGA